MNLGYAKVSKADGTKTVDLQTDALKKAGVKSENIYEDQASGAKDDRPGLVSCLKALRKGDTLFDWKLDRLGQSLKNLVEFIDDLNKREIGIKVLTGIGAEIDT